jgi:hypothetical protein
MSTRISRHAALAGEFAIGAMPFGSGPAGSRASTEHGAPFATLAASAAFLPANPAHRA